MGRTANTSTRSRLLGMLTGVALVATVVSGAVTSPAAADHDFPDVPVESPFHDDVSWLAAGGYANGYDDGTYRPAAPISRQAFVAMLMRLDVAANGGGHHDHDALRMEGHFPDVPVGHPFHDAIAWAAEEGLVHGYPDGTFRPTAPVSRQAAIAVLHRLSGLGDDYGSVSFTDIPPDHRFRTAIAWADMTNLVDGYQAGVLAGDHDPSTTTTLGGPTTTWTPLPIPVEPVGPTFEPTRAVSRQALAAVLHRFDSMMGHHWPAMDHHGHECTAPVTQEQQATADQLVLDVQVSLSRWGTTQDVVDAGYRYLAPPFGGAGAHYVNEEYMTDGIMLDPMKPESLMISGDAVQGAMFIMEEVGASGPMVGGCLTLWHAHDNLCYSGPPNEGGTVNWLVDMGGCPSGSMLYMTPEMLHVYTDGRANPFEGLET